MVLKSEKKSKKKDKNKNDDNAESKVEEDMGNFGKGVYFEKIFKKINFQFHYN